MNGKSKKSMILVRAIVVVLTKVSGGSPTKTLQEINRCNTEFWRERNLLSQHRLGKKMVLRFTIKRMNSENQTLPLYSRRSWDFLLEEADLEVKQEMTVRGQQGGRAPKADPLTVLIRQIVEKDPDISEHELLCKLKADVDRGTIVSVDIHSYVEYYREDGQKLRLPLSAVKDRLYRARKKTNSR